MKVLHTFKVDDQEFQIVKPNWRLENESFIFFKAQVRRQMDAGVLCEAALRRKLLEGEIGGESVQKELEEMAKIKKELEGKWKEVDKLKKEGKETKPLEEKILKLYNRYKFLEDESFGKVQFLTAEYSAKQNMIDWYVVHLIKKDRKDFFQGENFEDKINKIYDEIDDNEFLSKVYHRGRVYLEFYVNSNKRLTKEDWEQVDKILNEEGV